MGPPSESRLESQKIGSPPRYSKVSKFLKIFQNTGSPLWVPSHIPIPKYLKGNFMLQKFQEFKKKYLTLPWITLGLCVLILVVNLVKGG